MNAALLALSSKIEKAGDASDGPLKTIDERISIEKLNELLVDAKGL